MVHRLLERLDRFFAVSIVLVYLCGMFLGTATYFAGHVLGIFVDFAFAVAIGLAGAVEVHSFLSQRHTRAKWSAWRKLKEWDEEWGKARTDFALHFAFTVALVAFSMFNSCAFWALLDHPQTQGEWAQVILRGSLIPIFFLMAGFLTPLNADAGMLLKDAASDMLGVTLRATTRQWRRNVRQAAHSGVPLASVAATLMEDAGDDDGARRIRLIASSLAAARGEPAHALPRPITPDTGRPPTGPGTPSSRHAADGPPSQDLSGLARSSTDSASGAPRGRRRVAPIRIRAGAANKALDEQRRTLVGDLLANDPEMSPNALANAIEAAGLGACSWHTASRYKADWQRRQRARAQMAQ